MGVAAPALLGREGSFTLFLSGQPVKLMKLINLLVSCDGPNVSIGNPVSLCPISTIQPLPLKCLSWANVIFDTSPKRHYNFVTGTGIFSAVFSAVTNIIIIITTKDYTCILVAISYL